MISQWNIRLANEQTTRQFGLWLGQSLPAGSVLLLNGGLGSGKTTLVQSLGAGLGIAEPIVSPTFTLICEYSAGRLPLYHFDLYRLEAAEVADLHLDTYWDGSENPLGIVAIEWAERLKRLPVEYLQISFTVVNSSRQVELQATGATPQRLLQQLATVFF